MEQGLDLKTDLIILLLYSKGQSGKINEPIVGITRLMKLLFLLEREAKIKELFSFEPYKMGPFSSEVYPEIEFLENFPSPDEPIILGRRQDSMEDSSLSPEHLKIIEDIGPGAPPSFEEINKEFKLSKTGETLAQKLWERTTEENRNKIEMIKKKYGGISLRELLRYVYNTHPDMTVRSEIKHQL